jgi:hypothetical protein
MLRRIASSIAVLLLVAFLAPCCIADCGKYTLKVGNGLSQLTDAQQAGAEAARQARKALGDVPPKVVLVYDSLKNDLVEKEKLIEGVGSVFDKAVVFGCSSYSPLTQQSNKGTVGVLAMAGDVAVKTAVADLYDDYRLCGVKIGSCLRQQGLPDSKGKVLLLFGDCHVDKNDALVAGVKSILGQKYPIVGGASRGDFLYYKGKIVRKSNLGLLLSGSFECGFSTKKDNSPEGLINSARQACSEAVAGKKDDIAMTFAFDCGGRRGMMKDNLPKELAAMKEVLGDSPIFGFYGSGEIGPANNNSPSRGVGYHIAVCTIKFKQCEGFVWKSDIPDDCPFEQSKTLTGLFFTGRHSDYTCGDTWYPSWASDGNLYSPWTDGRTDGMGCSSSGYDDARTAHAVMIGDDPVNLIIRNTSNVKVAAAMPYTGRYPAGSLVYNGIWYYATYCLGPDGGYDHKGFKWNWPNLGPMPGFQISRDLGKTWAPSPLSPSKPLFPEPKKHLGPVKMGAPHFVDFGKNMEHSPDGKAYMLGMGAVEDDPMPRPCLKVGKPGEPFEIQPCKEDYDHANLSWISADQIYLARVRPSPETINDIKAWEFFAGHDRNAKPVWTNDFEKIKPLIEWNNNMGCVTATYVPGLKKYLMCVTDGWPTVAKMDSYILEADTLTGPWRMVTYMKDFGLNFPSKFISKDGRTLWLCYSANFSPGWNDIKLEFNPPGGRYGLCLHEVKLLP